MKRAVILHGTDGTPDHNWFPWLKSELEKHGYQVWVPGLPNSHEPDHLRYNEFLFGSGWDFTDNLVIGHSSGAVSVLNLLEDAHCPKISTAVMVSAWSDTVAAELDKKGFTLEQFDGLFSPAGFDFDLIKSRTDHILFIHGDDDIYCPLGQAEWLAKKTNSELIVIPGGGHIGSKFPKLTELTEALESRGWL